MVGIESIISNPTYLAIVAAGGATAAGILAYRTFVEDSEEEETIETEGMTERLKKIFVNPTESQGSIVKDYIKQRGTSNTPQLVGFAVRAKDNDVNVLNWDQEEEEFEAEEVKGTTYTVLEGSSKFSLKISRLKNFLLPKDLTETYDVPQSLIIPGDENIWFSPEAHFVKYNGVKRQMSPEGMGRVWDSSFAGLHENFLKTLEDIPEQYSTLNNRISGQLRVNNLESENIRKAMKLKNEGEKKDGMES